MRSLPESSCPWARVMKALMSPSVQLRALMQESVEVLSLASISEMACFLLYFFLFAGWQPDAHRRRRRGLGSR